VTTTKRIEARFRERRLGKVWCYTEDLLRETLLRAAEHWGRPPSTQEFEWWRERELELAAASGDRNAFLPSTSPYRMRFGTWEAALLHFGFTPEQAALRLEGKTQPRNRNADPYLPEGLPVAELRAPDGQALPLDGDQVVRMLEEWGRLARRSRYVLTVRLGLGGVEPCHCVQRRSRWRCISTAFARCNSTRSARSHGPPPAAAGRSSRPSSCANRSSRRFAALAG
jgi:hypothetical protein